MKNKKLILLVLAFVLVSLQYTNSLAADKYIYDTRVSLKVRVSPSINSSILTTLASGKDFVSSGSSTDKTEGGILRYWSTFAYPVTSKGKYTNSVRGYICEKEGKNDYYVYYADYATIAPSNGGYLYKDTALNNKYSTKYYQGKIFGPGNTYPYSHFYYGGDNLNAWLVKPDNVTKYMNGWLSYAKCKVFP